MADGPPEGGNGLATSRHDRPAQQDEEAVRRWGGTTRLQRPQYWHRTRWSRQALRRSWGPWAVLPIVDDDGPMKDRLCPAQTGPKSSLETV